MIPSYGKPLKKQWLENNENVTDNNNNIYIVGMKMGTVMIKEMTLYTIITMSTTSFDDDSSASNKNDNDNNINFNSSCKNNLCYENLMIMIKPVFIMADENNNNDNEILITRLVRIMNKNFKTTWILSLILQIEIE